MWVKLMTYHNTREAFDFKYALVFAMGFFASLFLSDVMRFLNDQGLGDSGLVPYVQASVACKQHGHHCRVCRAPRQRD